MGDIIEVQEAYMSTDERITKELIRTLENGCKGFAQAADRLKDSDRPELAQQLAEFSVQRDRLRSELRVIAADYGDDIEAGDGTVAGALHRGWLAMKDALAGSDASGVLDAAEQGEDHAVEEFRSALAEDLSPRLRSVVERQLAEIEAVHDTVRGLRDGATNRRA